MESSISTWLAAHLYYANPMDEFLTNAVFPFINKILHSREVNRYFFIRYWENGPHIRLRFKALPQVLDNDIRPELENWFYSYFDKFPSTRQLNSSSSDFIHWRPDNSIQFTSYKPEINRYGGPLAIDIAEQHFQVSSHAVLLAMRDNSTWTYNNALGVAIQMLLGFTHCVGMEAKEAHFFFPLSSSSGYQVHITD